MYTKQQRRSIYWTAYCCLDGEECDLTEERLGYLMAMIMNRAWPSPKISKQLPELFKVIKSGDYDGIRYGSPGWPQRREILIKAIEGTYKK